MPERLNEVELHLLGIVGDEYGKAKELFPPFLSAHEGYAIILEELDELKAEVFKRQSKRFVRDMRREALHVAAMALRFAIDICDIAQEE